MDDFFINEGLTKFLSLEEQKQIKNAHVLYELSSLGEERKRVYIYKDFKFEVDFKISVLKISYNPVFFNLTHRMILGSLIGLGIRRECIGDIYIDNDNIYVLVIEEMEKYIISNLVKVDKASVVVEKVSEDRLEGLSLNNYISENIIVSSLRLDAIISRLTNFSREKAKEYINLKNVKINGIIKNNINYTVKVDDLISIHRFGRAIFDGIVRRTKKNKYVLSIRKTK